jgi:hypothetical protein
MNTSPQPSRAVDGKDRTIGELLHEFSHPSEFHEYRNRIGDLSLLPKSFNASYGDLPYIEKREHYLGQNLVARSIHENAYTHNPGFKRFIEIRALAQFKKADLDARQELYRKLADRFGRLSALNRRPIRD